MAVGIPPSGKAFLQNIAELSDATFKTLISIFSDTSTGLSKDILEKQIKEKIPNISIEPSDIVFHLVSMNRNRISDRMSTQEYTGGVLASYGLIDVSIPPSLGDRLTSLLETPCLVFLARDADVRQECERLFYNARILSDVRPIFDDNCTSVIGATVIHNLRMRYHGADGYQDFFVALDADDLEQLKQVIIRAEKKSSQLASMLKATGVTLSLSGVRENG